MFATRSLRRGPARPTSLRIAARLFLAGVLAPAVLAPVALAGQADADAGWTPALSMRYRAVGGTAISPDGKRVAVVVREPVMEGEKSEYRSQIWMADPETGDAVQWTRGERSASSPAFSPDGRWLAFTTSRKGPDEEGAGDQVWVLPMAGGEARQATAADAGVGSYRWSPDGSRIAFLMQDPETPEEKEAKREKRDVILVDRDFKYAHLYVVRFDPAADGPATPIRLTAGEFHITGFDWAPDGTRIVFSHQTDPRINTGRLNGDVSVVTVPSAETLAEIAAAHAGVGERDEAAAGQRDDTPDDTPDTTPDTPDGHPRAVGEVTLLVGGEGVESSPYWSPDGRWIAFVSTGAKPEPIGLGDVWVVRAEGGEPRMLAETPNRSASIIAWAGDSGSLLLNEALGTTRHVIRLPLDGDAIERVTSGNGVLGAVSMTPDRGRMAFTWQTTDEPWDVYVSDVTAYAPRRVTHLHASVPKPEMGRTELVSWTSPDGLEIEGLLTYPVGYEEGTRVPLILNVHGGPAGVFSQSFTGAPSVYMLQYFAQQGFAILRPNPRGSTGYGKVFRYANFRDWGYGDFQDLMAGVDRVIEMGVGDPDRLLLMGWSYGGYMTSWAVTRTDRFRAASMGAGLPNLISMTTTTDIQDYLVGHMGVEYWEDYDLYEAHSAIYHIANVVTPTQVIHGANDLRVPFTQGQEFYRALSRRGVPTEMIVYPRTPHGPREPKFVMDVSERILAWFHRFLDDDAVTAQAGGAH